MSSCLEFWPQERLQRNTTLDQFFIMGNQGSLFIKKTLSRKSEWLGKTYFFSDLS